MLYDTPGIGSVKVNHKLWHEYIDYTLEKIDQLGAIIYVHNSL